MIRPGGCRKHVVCTQMTADVTEISAVLGQCDGVTGREETLTDVAWSVRLQQRIELRNLA